MSNGLLTIGTFVALITALTLSPPAGAQTDPGDISFPTHKEAASNGLGDVRRLEPNPTKSKKALAEDDEYAKALGFASAQEAGRATLGVPLPILMSRLYWLKQYTPGGDPQSFIKDTGSRIYPLRVSGKVKSSLTATKSRKTNRWRTTRWGSPKLIGLLERRRGPQSNMVLFISPQNPLGLRFLGENQGLLLLTPIEDIPRLGLTAGQQLSVNELFLRLLPVANEYNGAQLEGLKGQPPQP
jgi:hypothetical protein